MLRDRKYLCWVKLIQLQKKDKTAAKKTQKRAKFTHIEWMRRGRSGNMREEEFNARSQLTHSSCSSVSCQVWCWKKLTSVNIQQHLELKLQNFEFRSKSWWFHSEEKCHCKNNKKWLQTVPGWFRCSWSSGRRCFLVLQQQQQVLARPAVWLCSEPIYLQLATCCC